MDTNVYIKDYKSNGNKIVDVNFWGDWELEKSDGVDKHLEGITGDVIPDGVQVSYSLVNGDKVWSYTNNTGKRLYALMYNRSYNSSLHSMRTTMNCRNWNAGYTLKTTIYKENKNYDGVFYKTIIFEDADYTKIIGVITAYWDKKLN